MSIDVGGTSKALAYMSDVATSVILSITGCVTCVHPPFEEPRLLMCEGKKDGIELVGLGPDALRLLHYFFNAVESSSSRTLPPTHLRH